MKKAMIEITETDIIAVRTMNDLLAEKYNHPFDASVFSEARDLFRRMRDALLYGNSDKEDARNNNKYYFIGYVINRGRSMIFGHTWIEENKLTSLDEYTNNILREYYDNYGRIEVLSLSEFSEHDYKLLTSEK